MKTKRNRKISVSMILILVIATLLTPLSQIFASNSSLKSSGNSGGFIIETAKVDGSMDLIGALTGNISIYEGQIHGLTITKVMDRGKGLEPLVIRITSPGPIPVKNLNAQTMNNELPNIGGLCKPSQPGWICMENVVMNVEEQFVESISLSNANVHTCYLSECGELPDYNPLISLEELEEILNGDDEESDEGIQEIVDIIEEQEKLVEELEGILGKVSTILEELINQDYIGKIQQIVSDVEDAVTSNLGLDKLLPSINGIPATLENLTSQILESRDLLDKGGIMVEGLDKSIPDIEKKLIEYEEHNKEIIKLREQLGVYAILIELAEMQKAGKEIDYSLVKESEEEEDGSGIQALHERLDNLKTNFEEQKKFYEQLKTDAEELEANRKQVEDDIIGLKELLEQLGLGSDGDESDDSIVDTILDPVEDNILDPVKDNVLDPVKDKVLDPVLDPVKDRVLDPVKDKVVDPVLDPVKEKVLDPVKEKVLDPVLDPVTGKLLDPITGEVIDLVFDPVSEKLLDPITEKVVVPVLNPLTGKIINPLTGEVVERVYNQETGELLNPYTDSLLKRILEKILNPFNW